MLITISSIYGGIGDPKAGYHSISRPDSWGYGGASEYLLEINLEESHPLSIYEEASLKGDYDIAQRMGGKTGFRKILSSNGENWLIFSSRNNYMVAVGKDYFGGCNQEGNFLWAIANTFPWQNFDGSNRRTFLENIQKGLKLGMDESIKLGMDAGCLALIYALYDIELSECQEIDGEDWLEKARLAGVGELHSFLKMAG